MNGLSTRAGQKTNRKGTYNRCKLENGLVYGIPRIEHPKPIEVICAPEYTLVLIENEETGEEYDQAKHGLYCQSQKISPEVVCKKSKISFNENFKVKTNNPCFFSLFFEI
jgi:hypothetical protein